MSEPKPIPLLWALVPFVVMIGTMAPAVILFDSAPHIPLMIGAVAAGLVAWCHGYRWQALEDAIYLGIRQVLPALVILMLVGLLIASWAAGGLVGAMTYFGLNLLSPAIFLPTLMLLCAISTLMIGSSWSTIGTLGVAGLAVGSSMNLPAAVIVGAIVSGASFGDKMSPLSDTTVLASGITNVDIFVHIRHMLYTTLPGLLLALLFFTWLGGHYAPSADTSQITQVTSALAEHIHLSIWLLLVPLIVPLLAICKVPSIPILVIATIAGSLCFLLVQQGRVGELFQLLQDGYQAHSGNPIVDNLLNQGGLSAMMYTVSLAMVAMIFGGLVEHTGMLNNVIAGVLKVARTGRQLCATTVVSSFLTNVVTAEQYISIIIPGRLYANAFDQRGLKRRNLSRALEDGGTLTSPLVPWSTDAVFIYSTLGVSAWAYAPYALLNYSVPIISILMYLAGIAIARQRPH